MCVVIMCSCVTYDSALNIMHTSLVTHTRSSLEHSGILCMLPCGAESST